MYIQNYTILDENYNPQKRSIVTKGLRRLQETTG